MELIIIGLIIFLSGLIQGLSGFGSALVSMALLPFVMDFKTAVPLVAANAIIISAINYYSVRAHFIIKDFISLLIGSIIGAPIGIVILKFVNPDITKTILGILIITYSLYCIFKTHTVAVKLKPVWGYITGLTAGILGGACTVNGPPVIIYLTKKYENKHKIKAILAGFFLVAGIINIFMFALNGLYTLSVCKYSAGFAIFTILGVLTGHHYYNKINQDLFKKFIYAFLFISGAFLVLGNTILTKLFS
jgi:uncharacterized protein